VEPLYDLHGTVNHYGGKLLSGHYVSFVRSSFDGIWSKYDDSNRTEVSEDKLEKESAYLLVYVRKDLEQKSVNDVMPNIKEDFFPGKPVKRDNNDGFVVGKPV